MFEIDDNDYKCSLSDDTLVKAKKELGEKPETRLLEVKNLRSRVLKVPGLKSRTDINFLLPFLRVRKFDQERAFTQVKNYYQWKMEHGDIFNDLKPSRVRDMLDTNLIEVLKDRSKQGCRIFIWRAENWDEERYSITECLKLHAVVMLKLQQEEETQIHGTHFIIHMGKLTWKQALLFTPSVAKFYLKMSQSIIPLRLKRLDYVECPSFFDVVYKVFKQFMQEKIVKRVSISTDNFKELHTHVDPDILPTDLGGKVKPYSNTEWKESILNSEEYFEEDNKFGFLNMEVANERKENTEEDAGLAGLGGTFKKLEDH